MSEAPLQMLQDTNNSITNHLSLRIRKKKLPWNIKRKKISGYFSKVLCSSTRRDKNKID